MKKNYKSFFKNLKGKTVAFCGIGRSNLPLVQIFLYYGAKVIICDKKTNENIENLQKNNVNITFKIGEDYLDNIEADMVLRTPGMPFYLPELVKLREKGIPVTSEMELFFDFCPCEIIAVTGSDGKTTTTTIISEILKKANKVVHLGGNIGNALLPNIFDIKKEHIAVVELSSFQLISMRNSPDVAVVTNISPNHLDVHKDMEEYIKAKKNIVIHQNAFGRAVLNFDNDITKDFDSITRGEVIYFSLKNKHRNCYYVNKLNDLCSYKNNEETAIVNINDIKIPGAHNVANYLAAFAALDGIVDKNFMAETTKEFCGVEHRTEFVKEVNGVKYYNDSMATSPTRTISGTLSIYSKPIILISGGYDKNIPFDELGNIIVGKVKLLILMGITAEKIKESVRKVTHYNGSNPDIVVVKDMNDAVSVASTYAKEGDIVAMSPACASFDMYKDYEERGNHFKGLVNEL